MTSLTHVLAVGANSWGKGGDAVEAIQNWRKNFGSVHRPTTIHMRAVSADGHVDGMGTLYATASAKLPDVVITPQQADLIWNGIEVLNELCYPVDDAVDELGDRFKQPE